MSRRVPEDGFAASSRKAPRRCGCYKFNPQWEHDFLFMECAAGALCLVCGTMVTSLKKFNIERHYKSTHSSDYAHVAGDDRVNLVNILKEDIANPTRNEEVADNSPLDMPIHQPVPGPSTTMDIANDLAIANGAKEPKLKPKSEPVDYLSELSVNSQFNNTNHPFSDEDECNIVGKRFAYQLWAMNEEQRILAEKIIGDVMYYGRVGKLTENCFQYFPAT